MGPPLELSRVGTDEGQLGLASLEEEEGCPCPWAGTPRSEPGARGTTGIKEQLTEHLLQPGSGLGHQSALSEPWEGDQPRAQFVDGETKTLEA